MTTLNHTQSRTTRRANEHLVFDAVVASYINDISGRHRRRGDGKHRDRGDRRRPSGSRLASRTREPIA